MASDLTVQTIRGPGSGANANQILIPSGHKVVAPAGGLVAPGNIVQVLQTYSDIVFNTSSSSDVATGISINITPTSVTSKILIMMTGVCGSSFTTNFARGRINRSIAGGSYSGIGAEFFLGGNFAATYGNRTTEEWSHDFLDSPNTTSQITYQLYMKVLDGNAMYVGMWGQDVNWKQSTSLTVMEVAQ